MAFFIKKKTEIPIHLKAVGCTTNFPLDAFALLYFAFSLSFFQREGCPWDRVSLYWQSLKDEKGNLSYTQAV